jgi:hypothetical protein
MAATCSSSVRLQPTLHGVFAANASLCKVRVPDVANVLAALVIVQTLNGHAVLEFNKGLGRLERFENVRLALEQIDPPITRPVVNEGDPVPIAGQREHRNHVHIGVNALQQAHRAVQSLFGEGVGVVLADDARLTVQKRRGVVINNKAVGNVALDCLLKQVFVDVRQALMPEGTVPNVLTTQCALRRVWCAHVEPCRLVANCRSKDACAIAQEEHLSALNLDLEAMGSDEVQDSEEVVLERGDVKYTGQTHGVERLVEWLHDY